MKRPGVTKPILLVGLMGVGKSTVGKRLAARLGLPFVDSDAEIEAAAGMTISEMFERYGEGSFRDGERRVLARLMGGPPRVIASGGGAFMDPETRALAAERCTAVWLDADLSVLADRVRRRGNRPLLAGRDPAAVLADLAERRNPQFAEAAIHVRSAPQPHEATVDAIIRALETQGA